jgi:hypothetical protein
MSDLPPVVAATDLDSLVTAVVREDAEVDLTDCIRLERLGERPSAHPRRLDPTVPTMLTLISPVS